MQEQETIYPNDTTQAIRSLIKNMQDWKNHTPHNPHRDDRHFAMVLTKLEEAELLSLRMIKHEDD